MLLLVFLVFMAFLSWFSVYLMLPRLNRICIDIPNQRSSHHVPVPRGGGLSFVLISTLVCLFTLFAGDFSPINLLFLCSLPLSYVGYCDDRFNLPPGLKFLVQVITCICIIFLGPLAHFFTLSSFASGFFPFLFLLFLVLLCVSIINFVNFMDGLDGLVAGCLTLVYAAISFKLSSPLTLWALVGSLIGFLIWNWAPARVFMGDAGSTFLGAVLAGLVLQSSNLQESISFLLLATPLLADSFFCLIRRLLAGHLVFRAHRLHLFQRLHQSGWSHSRVSLGYISSTFVLILSMFTGGLPLLLFTSLVVLLVGFWLDLKIAVPFSVSAQS